MERHHSKIVLDLELIDAGPAHLIRKSNYRFLLSRHWLVGF
jgi:hypothetical protein